MNESASAVDNPRATSCRAQLPHFLTAHRASEVCERQRLSGARRLLAVLAGLSRRRTSCCFCSPLSPLPGYAHARESEGARQPPAKSAKRQKVRIARFLPGRKSPEMAAGTGPNLSRVCFRGPSVSQEKSHVRIDGPPARPRAVLERRCHPGRSRSGVLLLEPRLVRCDRLLAVFVQPLSPRMPP